MATVRSTLAGALADRVRSDFLGALDRIAGHARVAFRGLPAGDRDEAVAAAVAHAWQAFVRLAGRGRSAARFPSAVARFAVLAVWNGRAVGGRASSRDVLSQLTRRRRGLRVRSWDEGEADIGPLDPPPDPRAPVPDQVAFRLDF